MHIDPMLFISLVKQCIATEEAKQRLLNWLKQANLLSFQVKGCAVSEQLIQQLNREFSSILHTISTMDKNPVNNTACQQIFTQVSQFYTWLNGLSGKTEVQLIQQWHNSNHGQSPIIPLTESDSVPAPHCVAATGQYQAAAGTTHSVKDNRFD